MPGSQKLTTTTDSAYQLPGAPATAEASFDVAVPDKRRMLMIAGGVLLLGGAAYLVSKYTKKNGVGEVRLQKKAKKRKK